MRNGRNVASLVCFAMERKRHINDRWMMKNKISPFAFAVFLITRENAAQWKRLSKNSSMSSREMSLLVVCLCYSIIHLTVYYVHIQAHLQAECRRRKKTIEIWKQRKKKGCRERERKKKLTRPARYFTMVLSIKSMVSRIMAGCWRMTLIQSTERRAFRWWLYLVLTGIAPVNMFSQVRVDIVWIRWIWRVRDSGSDLCGTGTTHLWRMTPLLMLMIASGTRWRGFFQAENNKQNE